MVSRRLSYIKIIRPYRQEHVYTLMIRPRPLDKETKNIDIEVYHDGDLMMIDGDAEALFR